ncbi:MAG TPA: 50S ribosomal protein L29 [Ignavibacteriaceae bacterium]|jgi:large subunit ribosomal protein L29|nr:50S ribosomal protein L29 [Ignavibacteriaceae bacterium]
MKLHEIKEMTNDELIKRIDEEEKNFVDLRFSHQLKQLNNTAKLKLARKDIARMKTILKERLSAESKAAQKDKKEGANA